MIIIKCPCGKGISTSLKGAERKKYCSKKCFYKFRKRSSGLKYKIKAENRGWFKKNSEPWNLGSKGLMRVTLGSFKKGMHNSIATEFKYKNGKGYRHLLGKTLPVMCSQCGEKNIKRLHVHHIDRNNKNNHIQNLKVLCRPCHLEKHNKKERHYTEGRKRV